MLPYTCRHVFNNHRLITLQYILVQGTLLGLRQQLLQLLTEQSSLPKEIQILATLRKLDSLLVDRQLALERHDNYALANLDEKKRENIRDHILKCAETRLQMDFLEARTMWLDKVSDKALNGGIGATAALEQSMEGYVPSSYHDGLTEEDKGKSSLRKTGGTLGPYGRVIEMLEVNRTSWFNVVTQFNALFQENDNKVSAHPPASLLSAWLTKQTQKLLSDLQLLLPSVEDGVSLRSVLEQCLHFASRMGQVGGDFSGLVMPLFCKILTDRIHNDWDKALGHFKVMINNERYIVDGTDGYSREEIIPLYLKQEDNINEDTSSSVSTKKNNDDVIAPISLLAFPPLAYMLNSLLSGFNLIRECPIIRLRDEILDKMATVLQECCVYIIQHSDGISTRGARYLKSDNEGEKMNKMYSDHILMVLLPHILTCFEHIFPSTSTTTTAPTVTSDGNKDKKSSKKKIKLNMLKIVDPLSPETQVLLKENLSHDLCEIYNVVLEEFKKANLVKKIEEVSELSKLRSSV